MSCVCWKPKRGGAPLILAFYVQAVGNEAVDRLIVKHHSPPELPDRCFCFGYLLLQVAQVTIGKQLTLLQTACVRLTPPVLSGVTAALRTLQDGRVRERCFTAVERATCVGTERPGCELVGTVRARTAL